MTSNLGLFGRWLEVTAITITLLYDRVCVCQSVGSATRTVLAWATTIHTLTWRRRRARTARRSRHHPLLASLRSRRVSHSLVLRETERGEGGLVCMPCSMCVFVQGKSLSLSFFSCSFHFLILIMILNPKLGIRLFFSSISFIFFVFIPTYPSHCCFLLCTWHRVYKCIQQVRYVSCHPFIHLDNDLVHHQPVSEFCLQKWQIQVCTLKTKIFSILYYS